MTPEQMEQFKAEFGVFSNRKPKPISSRRYNLIVRKEQEEVETIEYLTMRQARELKAEYNAEGFSCDIIEDVSLDENGNEITFTPKMEIPEVKGLGGFGTPEATQRKIENDRAKANSHKARPKASNSKVTIVLNGYRNPKSNLYPMYVEAIRRRGYQVRDKFTGKILMTGLQNETAKFLFEKTRTGYSIKDFDIRYIGKE